MRLLATLLSALTFGSRAFAVVLSAPPEIPDSRANYVIYLHGAIVTGSDGRPMSPLFGPYEYQAILQRFEKDGFVVISEIRKDDGDLKMQAGHVVSWISKLRRGGVPSSRIAIVGASLGGAIAALVSASLADPDISYVLIASLSETDSKQLTNLHGRVLSIHDQADTHHMIPEAYFAHSPELKQSAVVITKTGLGHGLLYTPNSAWYKPAKDWIAAASTEPNQSPERTGASGRDSS